MTLRGYKTASDYIIELDIDSDVITNLNRCVKDKNYAKYRCGEAYVVKIYHKDSEHEINLIKSDYDDTFIYTTGTKVKVKNFNTNIDEICTTGIHFFLTKEAAYYHNLDDNNYSTTSLVFKSWSDDGQLIRMYNRTNGKLNGSYEMWNNNGIPQIKCNYNDDKKNGLYEEWFLNGKQYIKCNYTDDEMDGLYEEWYPNGILTLKCNYKKGKVDVLYEVRYPI